MAQRLTVGKNIRLDDVDARSFPHLVVVAMRPHQWSKNLFVLAPLLFGMKLGQTGAIVDSISACLAFCLMSSGLYLINDVVDIEADRSHPEKKFRPVASSALSIPAALSVSGLLLAGAVALSFGIGMNFGLLALTYCFVTLAYCFFCKHAIVLDAMLIAFGFVLRVVGGAVAIHVEPTHWLIVCAFLLALFLAFSKRRQELLMLSADAIQHRPVLGRYTIDFLDRANNIVLAATLVCYALYTVAPETTARFGTDKLIYGTVFVIYGLLRYLALLQDPGKGDNPSKMLLTDLPLLLSVIGWAIYNALVIYRSALHF